jgi:PhzF family phenazine biosynthesis protein
MSAFTTEPSGGNPAGVWIGDALPSSDEMLRIAAEVGYSETAFLAPTGDIPFDTYDVRYFSPLAEVAFCGHATIASGVVVGDHATARGAWASSAPLHLDFHTRNGSVPVRIDRGEVGRTRATLTSVEPRVVEPPPGLVDAAMSLLDWDLAELDPALPPAVAFAGVYHLVIVVRDLATLGRLAYPFDAMQRLMLDADLTTLQLVWRESVDRFRARDPFAVGGVVEDPATGAAAAAFGAYLRWRGALQPPARFTIAQGVEMGRPSLLEVDVPDATGGIRVSGTAVSIEPAPPSE